MVQFVTQLVPLYALPTRIRIYSNTDHARGDDVARPSSPFSFFLTGASISSDMRREGGRFGSVLYDTVPRTPPVHQRVFENTEIRAPACSTTWPEIPPHSKRKSIDRRPRRLFGVPQIRSSNIDFDIRWYMFGLHYPRGRSSFSIIRLPQQRVARFSSIVRTVFRA